MPDGRELPLQGTLTNADPAERKKLKVDEEGVVEGGSQIKRNTVFIGGGATAGAVIGAIAGGAALGAGIGAAANCYRFQLRALFNSISSHLQHARYGQAGQNRTPALPLDGDAFDAAGGVNQYAFDLLRRQVRTRFEHLGYD